MQVSLASQKRVSAGNIFAEFDELANSSTCRCLRNALANFLLSLKPIYQHESAGFTDELTISYFSAFHPAFVLISIFSWRFVQWRVLFQQANLCKSRYCKVEKPCQVPAAISEVFRADQNCFVIIEPF
jgi:hypothetical protein